MAFETDDEFMLPPSDDVEDIVGDEDVSILPPEEDEGTDDKKDEEVKDQDTSDKTTEPQEETPKDDTKEQPKDSSDQWEEDTLNLEELFKDVESMEETAEESSKILDKSEINADDAKILKENNEMLMAQVASLQSRLQSLMNEKTELAYANAEMKAFWGDSTNPKLIIINRNFSKALEGNEQAKGKAIQIIKDMYEDLTGSSIDKWIVDANADIISQVEMYNSQANPNLKWGEEEEYAFTL